MVAFSIHSVRRAAASIWTAIGVLVAIGCAESTLRAQELKEFPLPTPFSRPQGITVGSDGGIWFTERNSIGRFDIDGTLVEFSIPTNPVDGIVTGRDGALWFPAYGVLNTARLGRLTTSGSYSDFALPAGTELSLGAIAVGSDGTFWLSGNQILLKVTAAGQLSSFSLAPNRYFKSLTPGPDGNIWFTTDASVGKISPAGSLTEFPSRPNDPAGREGITAGIDGNIWASETPYCGFNPPNTQLCGAIARLMPSGGRSEFTTPDLGAVNGITNGSDGNLWFTQGTATCHGTPGQCWNSPSRLGRITPEGIITQFDLPVVPFADGPRGIVTGPDGNLWFADVGRNSIGRFRPLAGCFSDAHSVCLKDGRFRAQVAWKVADQGRRGLGAVLPLNADAAAFWFFSANNLEVIVKVVDGRTVNGKFWVFVGSLSDVEYEVTVTDTTTGAVRRYSNPPGTVQSLGDTSAF